MFTIAYQRGTPTSEGLFDLYDCMETGFPTVLDAITHVENDNICGADVAAEGFRVLDADGEVAAELTSPSHWEITIEDYAITSIEFGKLGVATAVIA